MALDLDLHHLRALAAVAEAGGFTAAAEHLGTTQSAVSRVVAEAERRLRTPMFVRSTRRVEPSAQGRVLLPVIRDLLDELDAGLRHLEGYLAGTRGTVTVAALPSLAALLLPPVVAEHRRRCPDVDVRVVDGLADIVDGLLDRGEVDLAVSVGPRAGRSGTGRHAAPWVKDRFFLGAHPEHRLAARQSVDWAELDGEPLVVFGPHSSIRAPVDRALHDAGVTAGPRHEAQNVAAVAGLVAAGLGVTAAPGLVLPLMGFAGLRHVPLVPAVVREIEVLHDPARPLSAAAAAFREALLASSPRVEAPDGVRWTGS